jgi:hypothetical protein
MRWYSTREVATFSRSANRATVALSPTIKFFIHGSGSCVDRHNI